MSMVLASLIPSAGALGSKEHLDWLKIDLNATEIITVWHYKHKKLVWMEVHICSVKAMESSR